MFVIPKCLFMSLESDYAEILEDVEINQLGAETEKSSVNVLPMQSFPSDLESKSGIKDLKYEGIENVIKDVMYISNM